MKSLLGFFLAIIATTLPAMLLIFAAAALFEPHGSTETAATMGLGIAIGGAITYGLFAWANSSGLIDWFNGIEEYPEIDAAYNKFIKEQSTN